MVMKGNFGTLTPRPSGISIPIDRTTFLTVLVFFLSITFIYEKEKFNIQSRLHLEILLPPKPFLIVFLYPILKTFFP